MKRKLNDNVREVRTLAATELRGVTDADGKNYLEGYAARYNVRSGDLGWGMFECLMPGAFTRALAENQDVRHLVNHDPSLLLGRTKAGTTQLSEDAGGLRFRTLLPDTQLARDLMVSVARGDINECSFGFICRKATWIEETDDKGATIEIRQVQDVDLFDVSTVTYPAYPETNSSLAMRTMFPDGLPAEIRAKTVRAAATEEPGCDCACPYCEQDRCEFCCNEYCREDDCLHGYPANHNADIKPEGETRSDEKTKKVDGEALGVDDFLIVGDKDDTSTWKLPIHFSTEEKTVSHIKNALARFNQLKDVPEDDKKAAWEKLVAAAKDHGIDVAAEDAETNAAVLEAEVAVKRALNKVRAIHASL